MKGLLTFALISALSAVSFWCETRWESQCEKAVAADHVRIWEDGMSINEICSAARKEYNVSIFRDEWQSVAGEDIALAPVVSGERICVGRDRHIYWTAAR